MTAVTAERVHAEDAPLAEARARTAGLFALALVAHGLAHTMAGIRATDISSHYGQSTASLVLITILWLGAVSGALLGAASITGVISARATRPLLLIAALSSMALLRLASISYWTVPGTLFDGGLLAWLFAPGAVPSSLPRRSLTHRFFVFGGILYVTIIIAVRPLHVRWGSASTELAQALPGDAIADTAAANTIQHAVSIDAPPSAVALWIEKLGKERWETFVLLPEGQGTRFIVRTREPASNHVTAFLMSPLYLLLLEPAHFIMERRMMLGVKASAERTVSREAR